MRSAPGDSALHDVTHTAGGPSAAPTPRRAWTAFAVALAAFAATTALVGAAVPSRAWLDAPLRAKMDGFAAEKDEIDVLVIGTSHLYRGVVPEVLDARLAERGFHLRSYNLAYSGMESFEADVILRQALALRPARLAWVIVELQDAQARGRYRRTLRFVGWHDLRETASAVRAAIQARAPAAARAEHVGTHVAAFAERATCLGVGPEVFRAWWGVPSNEDREFADAIRPGRGFLACDGAHPARDRDERRQQFLAEAADFASDVRRSGAGEHSARRLRQRSSVRHDARWLRAQIDAVRAAGAEPVYVVAPALAPRLASAEALSGGSPAVLDFDAPDRYPELFETRHRFDRDHLNGTGAALFSRVLADSLADHVLDRDP